MLARFLLEWAPYMEADAIYHGHAFDYVDTQNDPIAQALFRGALEQASDRGEVEPTLATGSLQTDSCVQALLAATGQEYRSMCWSPTQVRQHLGTASWPEGQWPEEAARCDQLTAQFFLQACAAGGYGIQFGS